MVVVVEDGGGGVVVVVDVVMVDVVVEASVVVELCSDAVEVGPLPLSVPQPPMRRITSTQATTRRRNEPENLTQLCSDRGQPSARGEGRNLCARVTSSRRRPELLFRSVPKGPSALGTPLCRS